MLESKSKSKVNWSRASNFYTLYVAFKIKESQVLWVFIDGMEIDSAKTYLLLWRVYVIISKYTCSSTLIGCLSPIFFCEITFPVIGRYLSSQVNLVLSLFLVLQILSLWCPILRWEKSKAMETKLWHRAREMMLP